MYHASKKLLAIRRQLKQMQSQYENGTDEEEPIQAADSNGCHGAELTDTTGESKSQPNVNFSAPMIIDQQDEAESNIMDMETTLESLTQCTTGKIDDIPLSEELRYAMSNMTDSDDVDDLIGNIITSVEEEPLYDDELQTVDHSIIQPSDYLENIDNYFPNSGQTTEITDTSPQDDSNIFTTGNEEENWRKNRQKKDNHNIIERRRRYYINDRIKELADLLPADVSPDQKQNKGSILMESVKHMKELKTDRQRIDNLEEILKLVNSNHQKLHIRISQVELKFKLYTWSEEFNAFIEKKKKNPKKRLSEINTMVEDHLRQCMLDSSQQKIETTPPDTKKNQVHFVDKKPIQDVRTSVRQHLSKKISAAEGRATGGRADVNVSASFNGATAQTHPEVRSSLPLPEGRSNGHRLGKNVARKTTTSPPHVMQQDRDNDIQLDFKEDGKQVIEISQEQCNILLELFENHQNGNGNEPVPCADFSPQPHVPAPQESLSPVTATSNMLERLLRRSDRFSPGGSSGLEESTGSMTGLR
ncbi:uncharacterized protein LOC125681160 [Ostrea edulis]|uniref:uncharacterized protein LOC125681160 n=1 Tax=Ostrea edulis TaxID=37623 RepID=UPI0024AF0185|nr:uncharacterized protein LOC125681160 [Ostrea edulis]